MRDLALTLLPDPGWSLAVKLPHSRRGWHLNWSAASHLFKIIKTKLMFKTQLHIKTPCRVVVIAGCANE